MRNLKSRVYWAIPLKRECLQTQNYFCTKNNYTIDKMHHRNSDALYSRWIYRCHKRWNYDFRWNYVLLRWVDVSLFTLYRKIINIWTTEFCLWLGFSNWFRYLRRATVYSDGFQSIFELLTVFANATEYRFYITCVDTMPPSCISVHNT